MYTLKGFVVNSLFVNNAPGAISAIGELSAYSATFSTEKGFYSNDSVSPDIRLITFLSAQDGTPAAVANDLRDRILPIIKWVYDQINTNVPLFSDQLLNEILTQFQSVAGNFNCGNIIPDGNSHWAPEWVSWTDNTLTNAGQVNQIKVWFVDASFQAQYDEYSFVFVPPITPLDNFFLGGTQVQQLVNARTTPQFIDQMQAAKNGNPETIQLALQYNYVDPANNTHLVLTTWGVLIYGPAGDNIDAIQAALIAYILANSTHDESDWEAILPDLFRRTEFILLPLWDQISIPQNDLNQGALYATITNLSRVQALWKATIVDEHYPTAQVDSYLTVMAHPWKNLQIASLGSTDNKNNQYELNDVFPDLLAVLTTSSDFGRMDADTRGFLTLLAQMLITAETMGPFTDLPTGFGFTRLTRNNILYLVVSYENIFYLVAAKQNLTQAVPPLSS